MAIELSTLTFTEQDDVVPASGVEEIVNTGVANTLAGNETITGVRAGTRYSIFNSGTLYTAEGNDTITGALNQEDYSFGEYYGIFNDIGGSIDTGDGDDIINGHTTTGTGNAIANYGSINTGNDNDIITATVYAIGDYPTYGLWNSGDINTGDGNDLITSITNRDTGISNGNGTINTGDGNDTITGTATSAGNGGGIFTFASLDTEKGNDIIIGNGLRNGIYISDSSFNTGDGNDIITGNTGDGGFSIVNRGFMDTGSGDDIITGNQTGGGNGNINYNGFGLLNGHGSSLGGFMDTGDGNDTITGISNAFEGIGLGNDNTINTGNGNDIITGTGNLYGIQNNTTINTGNGADSLISNGRFSNNYFNAGVFLGEGNDSIIANINSNLRNRNRALENFNFIDTGDGEDIITSTGFIYNQGVIETGNGNDSIIVNGSVEGLGIRYGIYNNGGAINMGDGNDIIIANEGFESGPNSSGAWFLGEGEDYIKGYGSGDFYGGNGNDTLELTPGTYTVGIWGEGGESPIFTKGDQLMITSTFEKLKAGSTIYDFTSLTAGQIIVVA